jgi:hypothetical protein
MVYLSELWKNLQTVWRNVCGRNVNFLKNKAKKTLFDAEL